MTEGVNFNEEQSFTPGAQFEPKVSRFAQALINWGLTKDERGANIILISIAIIFFVSSIFIFLKVFGVLG